MSKTLAVFRALELLLGTGLALRVLMAGNSDLGALYLLVLFAASNLPFMLIALWAAVFRPQLRRKALWVLVLPVAFVVLPLALRTSLGAAVPVAAVLAIIGLAVLGLVVWAVVRPRAAARRVPSGLFRSRLLNAALIGMIVAAWLLPAVLLALAGGVTIDTSTGQGSPGMAAAYMVLLAAVYAMLVGAASCVAGVWGWLGYRGGVDGAQRSLHFWQMLSASPGILVAGLVLAWLRTQT
jgi:hypothetical protein